ncbi:MAG TPA: aldo/keto reductase [Isosphaeraceae bacterium]|jgi:aryl-alcohol dehydrogenase-like predicted oxidoreductase
MQYRPLGRTGLQLPWLSYGASSLGQEFRQVDLGEAIRSVRVALDLGLTFIDTSPFYGRGLSECLLGIALRGVPRDQYLLGTKLGRYDRHHFDFSARRVAESVDVSLHRMGVEHLDILLCHDIEFVEMSQIVAETLPALRRIQEQGKARFIGISGYPMNIFRYVLDRADLDVILSYNHYTLQNTMLADLVPYLKSKGVGIMNAAPFSARLLTNAPLPPWHKATAAVRATCRRAAEHCAARGVDIAQLALQFSLAHADLTTCIVGSANPENVRKWAEWTDLPLDQQLLSEVLEILQPIHNWFYIEGRPENNDPQPGATGGPSGSVLRPEGAGLESPGRSPGTGSPPPTTEA